MPRVQVVVASRHGSTAGIADRIAEVLRTAGADVVVADAKNDPDPSDFDAYVIGSGVYMGSWLKEATLFAERHQSALALKPVWLFSSGPLPIPSAPVEEDRIAAAFGPEDGPGSGGHKKMTALTTAIRPREHRVFMGAWDPDDPPMSMPERLFRLVPASKKILPAGDFREWDEIETWAHQIAAELMASVAAA